MWSSLISWLKKKKEEKGVRGGSELGGWLNWIIYLSTWWVGWGMQNYELVLTANNNGKEWICNLKTALMLCRCWTACLWHTLRCRPCLKKLPEILQLFCGLGWYNYYKIGKTHTFQVLLICFLIVYTCISLPLWKGFCIGDVLTWRYRLL